MTQNEDTIENLMDGAVKSIGEYADAVLIIALSTRVNKEFAVITRSDGHYMLLQGLVADYNQKAIANKVAHFLSTDDSDN